jgi:hypothetical protein
MDGSFFPAPSSEPEPEPPVQVSPPWLQHPSDEYPARLLVREFLAQTEGTVLSVSHVDVYSTGLLIKIDWELRRLGESATEWQLATGMGHFGFGSDPSGSELRFGLALADGSAVTTVDRFRNRMSFDEEPSGWSLMNYGGGGGGGDREYSSSSSLWLWPLPPAGPIELVAEWKARGIDEVRMVVDGSALREMVTNVRSLWP